jgi:hypothetical protein
MTEEAGGKPSLMGVQRLDVLGDDDSLAYVTARDTLSEIVGVLSTRAAAATGGTAARLLGTRARFVSELQHLGEPDGVSVERVLADYPAILAGLREGE